MYEFKYLNKYETYVFGPIQKDEALFLHALCHMIRPKTVVEFGFQFGKSALAFTMGIDDGFVYSFDIDPGLANHAKDLKKHKLIICPQEDFEPSLIDYKLIDLAFIDGAHNLKKNIACFDKITPVLSFQGIIAIHDTGMKITDTGLKNSVKVERMFIQWLSDNRPDFHQIHFHAPRHFRHGITLLQKHTKILEEPPNKYSIKLV